MALKRCTLCRSLYDDRQTFKTNNICPVCAMKLNTTYNKIHDYLKKNGAQKNFNARTLAAEIRADPEEVQTLMDLGWLERDIQTYGGMHSERLDLAEKFAHELVIMKRHNRISTYGGTIYRRD